jgi:argininosuccinate lyase
MKRSRRVRTTVGRVDEAVLRYTAGRDIELDAALVEADCLGSMAHATMLSRLRTRPPILRARDLAAIRRELAAIARAARAGRFRIRPADQDVHLAIERTLTERLGDLGKRIHTARSRNDQVALDLRLYSREQLIGTADDAAGLAAALLAFAARHAAVPMVGRTHMQPAMPSSVGLWASAWVDDLLDDLALLMGAFETNDQCPLGSAAGYGVPLPIDRRLVADLLGFGRVAHNVIHAAHTRGKVDSVILFALGQAMLTLSRLAQDLILFSMPEFGYFILPAAFCTGSSIMPQKRNPDVLELVRARAARVMGAAHEVAEILRASPSGYNRDLQETKEPLMEGFASTRSSLRVMRGLVAGVAIDEAALRRGFTPDVFAADRALELVAGGVPFRDAYDRVKADLASLAKRDPAKAIAKKRHLGATAGLGLDALASRIESAAHWVDAERRDASDVYRRLLGVRPRQP